MDATVLFIIAIASLVFFSFFAYIFLMIYYPEWVGITGKVALDAEKAHQGEAKDSPFHAGLEEWQRAKPKNDTKE